MSDWFAEISCWGLAIKAIGIHLAAGVHIKGSTPTTFTFDTRKQPFISGNILL
jgi:hypothetical protein